MEKMVFGLAWVAAHVIVGIENALQWFAKQPLKCVVILAFYASLVCFLTVKLASLAAARLPEAAMLVSTALAEEGVAAPPLWLALAVTCACIGFLAIRWWWTSVLIATASLALYLGTAPALSELENQAVRPYHPIPNSSHERLYNICASTTGNCFILQWAYGQPEGTAVINGMKYRVSVKEK
jgi:hypothetical protein